MGKLRQKITNLERKLVGDILTTEVSPKGAVGLMAATVIGLTGCAGKGSLDNRNNVKDVSVKNPIEYSTEEKKPASDNLGSSSESDRNWTGYLGYTYNISPHSEHPTKCLDNGEMFFGGVETNVFDSENFFRLDAGMRGYIIQFEESDREHSSLPREDTRTKESYGAGVYVKPVVYWDPIEFFITGGVGGDYMPNNGFMGALFGNAGVTLNITEGWSMSVGTQGLLRFDGGHYSGGYMFQLGYKF